jgi:hypothetical protein
MIKQGLEEGLEAPEDDAANGGSVDFKVADARRPLDLPSWGGTDETDLHPLDRKLAGHGFNLRDQADCGNP